MVLAVGTVLWVATLAKLLGPEHDELIDLSVYRTGGQAWLHSVSLYAEGFPSPLPGPRLPFTYPPLAAVLFAGLAVLPWWVAVALLVAAGIAGLALACWLGAAALARSGLLAGATRPAGASPGEPLGPDLRRRVALLVAAALAAAPLLEPVRETISFGQINMLLVGMIAADCLLPRTPWPRGALIGLAAAIKLTPAAFVLFFLARRQWRPVLVAAGTFGAAGLLGLLLAPRDTRDYWTGALFDPDRIGRLEFASNQSLRGVLHRLALPDAVETVAWLGLAAAVAGLALVATAAAHRRGDDLGALLVTAAAALLASPVSWSHHWVWAVPGLLWLANRVLLAPGRLRVLPLAGTLAVFAAAPFWWLPYRDGREFSWSAAQQLLGGAYVWIGLAVLIAAAVAAMRHSARSHHQKAHGQIVYLA